MILIRLLRIKHWIKNLVIFIPIIFSLNFYNLDKILCSIYAFISFCLISSAVYIINDIFDKEKDKYHPIKKLRPIPNGEISIKSASIIAIILIILSVLISLFISLNNILIVVIYLLINILYSKSAKKTELVDVLIIGLGFILRILSGCACINVYPSEYIILLVVFCSCLLAFSKRYTEIRMNCQNTRETIKSYNLETLRQLISISASVTILFYVLYTVEGTVVNTLDTNLFYLTAFPFIYIIFRIIVIINSEISDDDLCNLFYKDKNIVIGSIIYVLSVLFFILKI